MPYSGSKVNSDLFNKCRCPLFPFFAAFFISKNPFLLPRTVSEACFQSPLFFWTTAIQDKGSSLCKRKQSTSLHYIYFYPLVAISVPGEENALSHSLYLLVVWIDVEEPGHSPLDGGRWWQIDHRRMGVMGFFDFAIRTSRAWGIHQAESQGAIGEYRHLPDRLRRGVCSGICTSVVSLVWLWGVIDSECVCTLC